MIYIGLASYDAKLHHSTVGGLFNVAYAMGKDKLPVCLDIIPHDCFIGHARSLMAKRFLSIPGSTDMVMVDADVGFSADDFRAIMKIDADIVCGIYPYKKDEESYPAAPMIPYNRKGRLVELVYGPAGFMRIRRKVFEAISPMVKQYKDNAHGMMHDFFPCGFDGVSFKGEDTQFCILARNAGFKIWGFEGLNLQHTGEKTWSGEWNAEKKGVTTILKAA